MRLNVLVRLDVSRFITYGFNGYLFFRNNTILLELGIDKVQGCIHYEAGDHLAVYPQNDGNIVDQILKYIQHDIDTRSVPYQLERASSG